MAPDIKLVKILAHQALSCNISSLVELKHHNTVTTCSVTVPAYSHLITGDVQDIINLHQAHNTANQLLDRIKIYI